MSLSILVIYTKLLALEDLTFPCYSVRLLVSVLDDGRYPVRPEDRLVNFERCHLIVNRVLVVRQAVVTRRVHLFAAL